MARIGVIGRSFGSAIATHLKRKGQEEIVLCHPRHGLSDLADCDVLILAFPALAYPDLIAKMKEQLQWSATQPRLLISVTKGLVWGSGGVQLPSEYLSDQLPSLTFFYAHLVGPAYADDLLNHRIVREVVAAKSPLTIERVRILFTSDRFGVYGSSDLFGVQAAAAFRPIASTVLGAAYGLTEKVPELSGSAFGSIFSRLIAECRRLVVHFGGNPRSVDGQAGLADLVMCGNPETGQYSRNWQFGRLLSEGMSTSEALERIGSTVEAPNTVQALCRGVKGFNDLDMPYTKALYQVLQGQSVREQYQQIMNREPGDELA